MDWKEFTTLLSGLMPKTPLGYIVGIRSENNEDILKHFTPEQHAIRDAWRSRSIQTMSEDEKSESIANLKNMLKDIFK